MASPTVEHRGTATQSGATQTYSIPGGSMSAGELLVVILGNAAGTESAMSFIDTGWDSGSQTNQGNDAGIIVGWYYSESGGETEFDISAQSGTETYAMMYVLSGAADPATQAPDLGGGSTGDSDDRDPPSVSITDGPEDVLVIAGWSQEGGAGGGQPSTPTNYSNALYQEAGGQPDAGGSAERALNTSSEDPGAFTGGTTDNWAAETVAVHPAAGADPLELSHLDASPTFNAPEVASGVALSHFDAAPTFHSPQIAAAVDLDLLDGSATFHTLTVEAGTATVDLDHLDAASTFHTAELVGTISLDHLDASPTFAAPAVILLLDLDHLDASPTFANPELASSIALDLLDAAPTFHTLVLDGTTAIALDLLDAAPTFHTITLGGGLLTINALAYYQFHRINGNLVLAPVGRSARRGFRTSQGFERVSDIIRMDQDPSTGADTESAMTTVASVWATHSGSDAATLKTAIHEALQDAGWRGQGGSDLT